MYPLIVIAYTLFAEHYTAHAKIYNSLKQLGQDKEEKENQFYMPLSNVLW